MLAERAEQYPEIAKRVVIEGHEVALHGANHDNLTRLGTRQAADRILGGRKRLAAVVGTPIRLFRPPYGAQTMRTFLLARLSGMRVVMWSVDPHDWDQTPREEIVERAVAKSGPGAVVLLHDGWTPTPGKAEPVPVHEKPGVVSAVVDGLSTGGLRSTSVGELLKSGPARKRVWFSSG